MKDIEDINLDMSSKVYLELIEKIKLLKEKGKPLLIKINSHPCAGKSTFIKCYNEFRLSINPFDCKLYDFDSFPEGEGKTSSMLLEKTCNSVLLGCSGGGIKRPFGREIDYDIHENIIYIFIFPKLINLYKNIAHRQLIRGHGKGWCAPSEILKYRNNMYSQIIKDKVQVRPLFYSFEEGLKYCIKVYRCNSLEQVQLNMK
jgi:hypothetical protein